MKEKDLCRIIISAALMCLAIALVVIFMNNGDPLPFKDKNFSRDVSGCGEHIVFSDEIHYYESCGNPVGSFDLCNTYSYNSKKQSIMVNCGKFKEKFEFLDYDSEGVLVLKHDGETKIFYEDGSIYEDMFENGYEFFVINKLVGYNMTCRETIEFNDSFVEISNACKDSWLNNKKCYSYTYDYKNSSMRVGCYDYDTGFRVYDIDVKMKDDIFFDLKIDNKIYTYKSDLELSNFDVVGNYSSKYVKEKITITDDEFVVISGIYHNVYKYKLYKKGSSKLIYVYNNFGYSNWYMYDDYSDKANIRIWAVEEQNKKLYRDKLDLYE